MKALTRSRFTALVCGTLLGVFAIVLWLDADEDRRWSQLESQFRSESRKLEIVWTRLEAGDPSALVELADCLDDGYFKVNWRTLCREKVPTSDMIPDRQLSAWLRVHKDRLTFDSSRRVFEMRGVPEAAQNVDPPPIRAGDRAEGKDGEQ